MIDTFFFVLQIITKKAIWMLAGQNYETRKTDMASKLRHESSRGT